MKIHLNSFYFKSSHLNQKREYTVFILNNWLFNQRLYLISIDDVADYQFCFHSFSYDVLFEGI